MEDYYSSLINFLLLVIALMDVIEKRRKNNRDES